MERPIQIALHDAAVAYARDGQDSHTKGFRIVLQDIHLEIAAGQSVALVGSNGSGKSTLLRVIAGLLPLSRGTLTRADDSLIPVVFQNPDAQIVGETVIEDICFGLENIALPPDQMEERVVHALAAVGLAGFEERPVIQLSGGQKQLVCIASAIAMNPSVIVMDEPTAMLDPTSKAQVMAILEKLRQDGKTVIWATQSFDEIRYADRVLVLDAGRIVYDASPEVFFYGSEDGDGGMETEAVPRADEISPCRRFGFRLPYAIELIQELQQRGMLTGVTPLRDEDCMEAVSRLCR